MKNLKKSVSCGNPAKFVWQNNAPTNDVVQRKEAVEAMKELGKTTAEVADKMVDSVLLFVKAGKEVDEPIAITEYEYMKKGVIMADKGIDQAYSKITEYSVMGEFVVGAASAGIVPIIKYGKDGIKYVGDKTYKAMDALNDYMKTKIDKIF